MLTDWTHEDLVGGKKYIWEVRTVFFREGVGAWVPSGSFDPVRTCVY
jgi:hypothetical protein